MLLDCTYLVQWSLKGLWFVFLFYISFSSTAAQTRRWTHTRAGATPSGELRYKHCMPHTSMYYTVPESTVSHYQTERRESMVACSSNLDLPNLILFIFSGKALGKHFWKLADIGQQEAFYPLSVRGQNDVLWSKDERAFIWIRRWYCMTWSEQRNSTLKCTSPHIIMHCLYLGPKY